FLGEILIKRLEKIAKGNPQAIEALEDLLKPINLKSGLTNKLLKFIKNILWRCLAFVSNRKADNLSFRWYQDEYILINIATALAKIDPENPKATNTFIDLLSSNQNPKVIWRATSRLKKIAKRNPELIKTISNILMSSKDTNILGSVIQSLEEVEICKPDAIQSLVSFLNSTQDNHLQWETVKSLGKIGKGSHQAIKALVQVLKTLDKKNNKEGDYQYYSLAAQTAKSLTQILENHQQIVEVVTDLKDCKQLSAGHQVLWYCAQNLTYPEFFQAWNSNSSKLLVGERKISGEMRDTTR
ncbi:MAG: HEAT repeat domain-containing protein, partial [Tolypothrix sp. Co-bin9]|nr:HEAT repeat domain-containing protein [Tolypothrix sp. Co-bin9]